MPADSDYSVYDYSNYYIPLHLKSLLSAAAKKQQQQKKNNNNIQVGPTGGTS